MLPIAVDGTVQRQPTVGEHDLPGDSGHLEYCNNRLGDVIGPTEATQGSPLGQRLNPARQLFGLGQHGCAGDPGAHRVDADTMDPHSAAATRTNMSTPALDTQ